MKEFSVPPNYVASLQENLTDDVLRTPNADPPSAVVMKLNGAPSR